MRSDAPLDWSAYPALLMAGAFASGILLRATTGWGGVWFWIGGVVLGCGGFAGVQWRSRRRMVTLAPLGRFAAIALVGLCAGSARHAFYEVPSPRTISPVAAKDGEQTHVLAGTVADAPERDDASVRFTLSVDSIMGDGGRMSRADGRVRVTLQPSPWEESVRPFPPLYEGNRLRLRGSLRRPSGKRNPGGFDYAAYLDRRGICCTMYVSDPADVKVSSRAALPGPRAIVAARKHIRRQLARYVPSADARAVLQALLLGDRSGISDRQERWFSQTGLMHLLAVSGLHVFLVGMVLYVLLRPLLMRFRLGWKTVEAGRAVLTVFVLCLYMALTGGRPSVVRAVVMSSLLIGGLLVQRSAHPLNTLGVAALVLMAARPPALFDAGFQLSMSAVAGIVNIHPQLVDRLPDAWTASAVRDWLVSVVSVSAAATLATAPVLLFHFGWVSGAGLLLNLMGIPCTALALTAAIALVVFGGVWPVAGAAFGSSADLFVDGLLFASREGGEWLGWFGLRLSSADPFVIGTTAAGVLALAQWSRPRLRWRLVILGLFLATMGTWIEATGRMAEPTLDVLFFDVRQGDAVLTTTPSGKRVLVDTGPRSSPGQSVAAFTVIPYLRERGIEHLDTVVITHPDSDHLGGLPDILGAVSVGRVLHSGQQVETDLYRRSRQLLREKGIPHRAVDRGEKVAVGPHVQAQILSPPHVPARHGIKSENGSSVVLRFSYGNVKTLLPGDIEAKAEADLVRTYGRQLRSRIVKVPHHGSETSSTPPFVKAVVDQQQSRAVISVGASNRFGMPSPDVVSRWRSAGATVRSTARRGAVWLRSDGQTVWSVQWK